MEVSPAAAQVPPEVVGSEGTIRLPAASPYSGGSRVPQQFGSLLGGSPEMCRIYEFISRVAASEAIVLIVGESGTGKELVARIIHDKSNRCRSPFLTFDCDSMPPELHESELFGRQEDSRRGVMELVGQGTLLLKEISSVSVAMQLKLLCLLESGYFTPVGGSVAVRADARILVATTHDPKYAVAEGRLREDFMHRLSAFPVWIPPLRDRCSDIGVLALHFLANLNRQHATQKYLSRRFIEALFCHSWPGNVRELRDVIYRAYTLATREIDLPVSNHNNKYARLMDERDTLRIPLGTSLRDAERTMIFATLSACGGNKRRAAELLGVSLKTLYNKLSDYASGKSFGGISPATLQDDSQYRLQTN